MLETLRRIPSGGNKRNHQASSTSNRIAEHLPLLHDREVQSGECNRQTERGKGGGGEEGCAELGSRKRRMEQIFAVQLTFNRA